MMFPNKSWKHLFLPDLPQMKWLGIYVFNFNVPFVISKTVIDRVGVKKETGRKRWPLSAVNSLIATMTSACQGQFQDLWASSWQVQEVQNLGHPLLFAQVYQQTMDSEYSCWVLPLRCQLCKKGLTAQHHNTNPMDFL